jgi:hypothetical protein
MSAIARLRAQIQGCTSKQGSGALGLQEPATQLDGARYPVLTLPCEITSHIFIHCLASDQQPEKELTPSLNRAPLLLLQVCTEWRSIAISTPQLWDHIHLDFEAFPLLATCKSAAPAVAASVEAWFSRASQRPLSLAIVGSELGNEKLVTSVVCAVLPLYTSKIRRLSLQLRLKDFKRILDIGPFPLLENLTVGLPFVSSLKSPGLNIPGIIANAPRLRHLSFLKHVSPSSCLELPWKQLTTFMCERLSENDLFDVLRQAKGLIECTCSINAVHPYTRLMKVNVHGPGNVVAADAAIVVHERLRTLRLVEGSDTEFLQSLRLPKLQHLHLDSNDLDEEASDPGSEVDDDDFGMTYRSHRSSYTSSGASAVPIMKWLAGVSSLTTLEIRAPSTPFSLDFIAKLDRTSPAGDTFLPLLHTLALLDYPLEPSTALVRALSSRATTHGGMARLESFRQASRRTVPLSAPVLDALRDLAARGMKIRGESKNQILTLGYVRCCVKPR